GDPRGDGARSRAGAAPRGRDHRGRRRRGDQPVRGGPPGGARADRGARGGRATEAARRPARERAPGGGGGGPGAPQGDPPAGRRGQADPAGPGAGARAAVDAREGWGTAGRGTVPRRGARATVDTNRSEIDQLASRGIRSAKRNKGEV